MATNDKMIAALLREREGYERRDLTDRVRQVDEQLEHYGYKGDGKKEPQGRTSAPQQTADQAPKKTAAKKTPAKKTAAAPAAATTDPAGPEAETPTESPAAE
ncbi:hypothetical protein AB0911_30370 [Streptomyces nigra]|uniref:hypothetical protein n=1 Tax=Streptomyces nigra TaxID=1827580 RepID=UPI0034563F75